MNEFPKTKDEMKLFLMIKKAEFLLNGGEIKKIGSIDNCNESSIDEEFFDSDENVVHRLTGYKIRGGIL